MWFHIVSNQGRTASNCGRKAGKTSLCTPKKGDTGWYIAPAENWDGLTCPGQSIFPSEHAQLSTKTYFCYSCLRSFLQVPRCPEPWAGTILTPSASWGAPLLNPVSSVFSCLSCAQDTATHHLGQLCFLILPVWKWTGFTDILTCKHPVDFGWTMICPLTHPQQSSAMWKSKHIFHFRPSLLWVLSLFLMIFPSAVARSHRPLGMMLKLCFCFLIFNRLIFPSQNDFVNSTRSRKAKDKLKIRLFVDFCVCLLGKGSLI